MKTKLVFVTLLTFAVLLFACSSADVEVKKAEFVPYILYNGGVSVTYKDGKIIKMTLNFNFKNLNTKEKEGTDAYSSEVYQILSEKASMNSGDSIIKATYGFWPEKITKTSASGMVMFYVIPNRVDINKLVFVYDASILGGESKVFTYSDFNKMKPL